MIQFDVFNTKIDFSLTKQLLDNKNEIFLVDLEDGPLEISGKFLMLNVWFWKVLIDRNVRPSKKHCLLEKIITKENQTEILTHVENTIHERNPNYINEYVKDKLGNDLKYLTLNDDICMCVNNIHRMVSWQVGSYEMSCSAFEICDMLFDQEYDQYRKYDIKKEERLGIKHVEKKIANQIDTFIREISENDTILSIPLKVGAMSKKQIGQVFVGIGYRTDADDTIVMRPITENYLDGLNSTHSYLTESLAGKKTIYYNKDAMPDSQYSNRRQQIQSSIVQKLYAGDCGTDRFTQVYIHAGIASKGQMDGKLIYENGVLTMINRENAASFYGKYVNMRSPFTCNHTDGTCAVCLGALAAQFLPSTNIGLEAAQNYMSDASQLVLSAKHFTNTDAVLYGIPPQMKEYLFIRQNDICLREEFNIKPVKVGIPFINMKNINDLNSIKNDKFIHEQHFSSITEMLFIRGDTGELISQYATMPMNNIVPFFSLEFLKYIKANIHRCTIDNMIWIPLDEFNAAEYPIMRYTIESSSMVKFNNSLSNFMLSGVASYTSISDVLRDFSELVYKQITTNFAHIEIVLKSYLKTSKDNYRIPIIRDPNNVMFDSLGRNIPRRSIGAQFAYEKQMAYLTNPKTYLEDKPPGFFDTFMGLTVGLSL